MRAFQSISRTEEGAVGMSAGQFARLVLSAALLRGDKSWRLFHTAATALELEQFGGHHAANVMWSLARVSCSFSVSRHIVGDDHPVSLSAMERACWAVVVMRYSGMQPYSGKPRGRDHAKRA
eukprot:Hpha_TRINITY_DN16546_c3_g1::TRINITY_DN16546_c3_g1_i3::g.134257::m.134257